MENKLKPLVSVIVPTKNSELYLKTCLDSIINQTYENIELIVVDNYSTDGTVSISKKYTSKVYSFGPERSSQVNYGVNKARGEFVYKVDSDFLLDKNIVSECVDKSMEGYKAIVVHNTPDSSVSWLAKIRKFEVDMYKYDLMHSSARFISKKSYLKIGGYDPHLVAGEDYDFQNKINNLKIKTGFIDSEAIHLGEPRHLLPHLKKYYAYGRQFNNYLNKNSKEARLQIFNFTRIVYIKNWRKFLSNPKMTVKFIIYNTVKYLAGFAGLMAGKLDNLNLRLRKS